MVNQQPQHMYVPQMASIAERINNPPRLVQAIQCHNEEEFIGGTLRSIYDEVDQIIVIEGAVKNRPNSTEDGHSTDRTVEIINDFKDSHDPDHKILFIQIGKPFENLEELKQTFIDLTTPGDWLIINDADEFYRPTDIRRLRTAIDRYPHAQEFVPLFLHFYGDYEHIAVPGPEWQPQHQRVFKVVQGMKYHQHPVVHLPNGESTYFSPYLQHRRYMLNDFFIYHYGYARQGMDDVMKEKQAYYEKELAAHGAANVKFDEKVQAWFDGTEPVLEFKEPVPSPYAHPEHTPPGFKHEPVRGKVVGDWREAEPYKQALSDEPYGNIWLCMTQQSHPPMNHFHNAAFVAQETT